MRVYRASRKPRSAFDPLDASGSVGRSGWRFNDSKTEVLYAAEREALSLLEIVVRPGWDTVREITVAVIEIPDGSIVRLDDLGIVLPTNWNSRPAAKDAQSIGREILDAIDARPPGAAPMVGAYVPSVISTTDCNVLLDPRQKAAFRVVDWLRVPFETLRKTAT